MSQSELLIQPLRWSSLPAGRWPVAHQTAWRKATQRGSPVRRGGHASSLAPATRHIMQQLYGQFLWWLGQIGSLDPDGDPASQMTRELMTSFTTARREAVSANTLYNNLRMLTMMMNTLCPEGDWQWIWKQPNAPCLSEARASRRPLEPFSPGVLMCRLLEEMHALIQVPSGCWVPLERLRDCLMVATSIYTALRQRNLVEMRLDHNLIRRKDGWEVIFDAHEIKNGTAFLARMPSAMNPFIDRYIDVARPRLLGGRLASCDAVWVTRNTRKGGAIQRQGIRQAFADIGRDLLGQPIKPHSVRHALATRMTDHDPLGLHTASLALAHTDVGTAAEFYDRSCTQSAQKSWLTLVSDIRSR